MSEISARAIAALGFFVLLGVAWLVSEDRHRVDRRAIAWGIGLQFAIALALQDTLGNLRGTCA